MSLFSKENSRFSGLAGTRISRKNSLKSRHQTYTPCIAGDCTSITRSELGVPLRRSLVATNRKGKWGKHNQVRIERSWVRRHEKGRSWEGHTSGSGSLQYSGKQPGLIEETISLKDDQPLDARGIGEQGSLRLLNQPRREVLEDVISSPEYQKIQDLKFSGDMWEGDSGPQVLDLQRALYWYGFLPKRTELTAYFGPGTKRALQQFQIAQGVPGTGVWGSSSRQALWKLLNVESSSSSEGGSSVQNSSQQTVSSWLYKANARGAGVDICVSELMATMGVHGQEFMSTWSSAPYWRSLPTNFPKKTATVGVLVVVMVTMFGLGYSVVGLFHAQHGQPVRRRVLRARWRDDLSGRTLTKSKRHLDMFPGLSLPLVEEENSKYNPRSKSKLSSANSAGRTDRLILYEGQVLTGDETPGHVYSFMPSSASRRSSGKASQVQATTDQTIHKPASRRRFSGPREQFSQESQGPSKMNNVRIRGTKTSRVDRSSEMGGNDWLDKDEENFKKRVEDLRKAVQATEKNRLAAMRALAEERQRSLELQVKISRQKETAAALEEEVRVLKESHDALLASLRKKYSSSVAARAAAALLYQNWDTEYEEGSPQTLSC